MPHRERRSSPTNDTPIEPIRTGPRARRWASPHRPQAGVQLTSISARSSTRCAPTIAPVAQWRPLPADVPPMRSVRPSCDPWNRDGPCVKINDPRRTLARPALDRNPEPSISVLDFHSVTTTDAGGERGDDGGTHGQRTQTAMLG